MRKRLLNILLVFMMVVAILPSMNRKVDAAISYRVIIDDAVGGTVSADKNSFGKTDDTITLTVTPNEGYKLKSLSVTKPEDIDSLADLVTLFGDAEFTNGGNTLKIVNGEFTAYDSEGSIIKSLNSEATLTVTNSYSFSANDDNWEWRFSVYGGFEFGSVQLYYDDKDDDSLDRSYYFVGNNTGSLFTIPVTTTTVTEEKEYSFLTPAAYVKVTAEFELLDPKTVLIDVGSKHASLFTEEVLNSIKSNFDLSNATITGNVITLSGVNPNNTEGNLSYSMWQFIYNLVSSNYKIDNGEEFLNVGYKSLSQYKTMDDLINDLNSVSHDTTKVKDNQTFYILWASPLETLNITVANKPEDKQTVSDYINNFKENITLTTGVNYSEKFIFVREGETDLEDNDIFEDNKTYTFTLVNLETNQNSALWKNFIDAKKVKLNTTNCTNAKINSGEVVTDVYVSFDVSVGTDPATVTTAPVANDLVANNSAQALVTAGSATGGTMQYALGTDATTAPTDGWSETIPTGTDNGTYYVWYKAKGDADHKDSTPICVTVVMKEIHSGAINSNNAPETLIASLISDLVKNLLTETETTQYNNGIKVDIYLNVGGLDEAPATEKELIDTFISDNGLTLGKLLDIELFKRIGITAAQKIENVPNGSISVTITVPDDIKTAESGYTRTFTLFRIHGGVVEKLLETTNTTLTFASDKFSTYVIGYKDTLTPAPTPAPEYKVPKTGIE